MDATAPFTRGDGLFLQQESDWHMRRRLERHTRQPPHLYQSLRVHRTQDDALRLRCARCTTEITLLGVPRTEALHAAPLLLPAGEERMQRRRCTVLRLSSPVASALSDDVGRRAKSLAAASARIRAPPDDIATHDI